MYAIFLSDESLNPWCFLPLTYLHFFISVCCLLFNFSSVSCLITLCIMSQPLHNVRKSCIVLIVPRSDERCKEQSTASSVPAILRDTIVKNGEGYHVQSTVCSACYNLVGDLMRSKKLGWLLNSLPQIENGYLNIGSALKNH